MEMQQQTFLIRSEVIYLGQYQDTTMHIEAPKIENNDPLKDVVDLIEIDTAAADQDRFLFGAHDTIEFIPHGGAFENTTGSMDVPTDHFSELPELIDPPVEWVIL